MKAAPAFRVFGALRGAVGAEVEQVELVIAAHDGPLGSADDVDYAVVEGHGVDEIAVKDDEIGLKPFQLGEDGLQRGQVSVDVGEDGQSHGLRAFSQEIVCGTLPAMLPVGWRTVKRRGVGTAVVSGQWSVTEVAYWLRQLVGRRHFWPGMLPEMNVQSGLVRVR